jgi:hypothetical protein
MNKESGMTDQQKFKRLSKLMSLGPDVPKEIQAEAIQLFLELFGDNEKVMKEVRDVGAVCTVDCTFHQDGKITIDDQEQASEMEAFLDRVIANKYRRGGIQ